MRSPMGTPEHRGHNLSGPNPVKPDTSRAGPSKTFNRMPMTKQALPQGFRASGFRVLGFSGSRVEDLAGFGTVPRAGYRQFM